ncbi:MAG: hypothetical protein WC869_05140 [Phycisphaerae bacterium]|jgi:hypothetical protein
MNRYLGIESLTFGQLPLPLPLSVHLSRQVAAMPAGGDGDLFATSIQLAKPTVLAEVRIRDTAAAEGLTLGEQGDLSFIVTSSDAQQKRCVSLAGAVLVAVEYNYEQTAMATASLRFLAESDDGAADPFKGEVLP